MVEMPDPERLIWQQAQRIKELEQDLRLTMRTLDDEIMNMQAASIAERLAPGSGMKWIDDSLCEALTYPCDGTRGDFGPHWDGKQSAIDWWEQQRTSGVGEASS